MNYILYLAFNGSNFISEAICSIHSFLCATKNESSKNIKIIVYTDMIDSFKEAFPDNKDIGLEALTDDIINNWIGEDKFFYRLKVKILQDFFKKYNSSVILIDPDTFFLESPERLFERLNQNNSVLMHCSENTVGQRTDYVHNFSFKGNPGNPFFQYLKDCTILSDESRTYEIHHSIQLWNSGVVGINPSDAFLLDEVLNLTDVIYKKFEDRLSEQFSFAYILQNNRNINSCDDLVFHYWYLRHTKYFLAYFFKCLSPSDEIEFLSILRDYNLEGLYGIELEYEDMPLIVACLIKSKYSEYYNRRIKLDIPKETYFGKLFIDDSVYDKQVEHLLLKYKLDFGAKLELNSK